jgi:hypothetical protein
MMKKKDVERLQRKLYVIRKKCRAIEELLYEIDSLTWEVDDIIEPLKKGEIHKK